MCLLSAGPFASPTGKKGLGGRDGPIHEPDQSLRRCAQVQATSVAEASNSPPPTLRIGLDSKVDGGPRGRAHHPAVGPAFDEVLKAAQEEAGWALTRLYESLAPAVAAYLRAQGLAEQEDVTSDVFLVVLSRVGSFSGTEAQFRSWVFTIAHSRLVDHRRASARRPDVDSLDADADAIDAAEQCHTASAAEDDALQSMGTARVEHLLDALAPDQRAVLALRILADVSVEGAACVLGKQPGAVKALQRRAIAALRRSLSQDGRSVS